MPRIPLYEQQYSTEAGIPARQASPTDLGGTGTLEVGRAVQSLGQDLGYAQRQMQIASSQRAVSDVYTALSMFRGEYTKKAFALEAKADPADTTIANQFLFGSETDDAEPAEGSLKWALDAYRAKVQDPQALQAFDRGASDLTERFTVHFAQVQSRMAGVYAKQQAERMVNAAQDNLQTDPSQYTDVLQSTLAAVDDPHGIYARISAEQREPIKRAIHEQLASSTVRGMIRDAPDHALHSLERGEWDREVTGEQKIVLMQAAQTAIHAKDVAERQRLAEEKRQLEELRHQTDRNLTAKYFLHLDNPGNPQFPPVTATEVAREMAAGQLDGAVGRALINMMQADAHERTLKRDNATYWDLFLRTTLPWGHPNKLTSVEDIYQAAAKRQLTPTNVKDLTADFDKSRSEQGQSILKDREVFLSSMKSSITHSNLLLGKLDQEGDINFGRFTKLAMDEEAKAEKENRDPHELYDEKSKYYLGNKMGKFRKSLEQSMETITQGLRKAPSSATEQGGVPEKKQRLPGETPEQYLDRMKK
jgi:hypothetical protein